MIENSKRIRTEFLLFALGSVVLAYIGGAYSARFQTFPYSELLKKPFDALEAKSKKYRVTKQSALATTLWHPARSQKTGLVKSVPEETFGKYTLYASPHAQAAYLLDSKGLRP